MQEIKQIVAATDLSAPARHAVERAALVAGDCRAQLAVAHVTNLAPLAQIYRLLASDEQFEVPLTAQAEASMQQLAAALSQRFAIQPAISVMQGELLPSLLGYCATLPAELLVLGARGSSFMRHILLGTTAERLLRMAKCPLLVVKQPPHESYRRLLVAVDFSPAALPALHRAQAIAPQADLVLLHVYDVPFAGQLRYAGVDEVRIEHYRALARHAAEQKMDALLRSAGLDPTRTRVLILPGDASQRILEQEQEFDCDLLVVGKQGDGAIEALLLGSVTKHVLAESQGDVLVSV